MVRITKISAGTLLLILSIILMIKSGFENFIAALVGTGAIGGAAGILLAITYIIAAAIYILTNRTYSIVPDAVSFVILILGGLMGLFNSNLPDTKFLVIWSWVGIVIGAIVLIISIVDLIMNPAPAEDDEPDNGYNNEYGNNGFDQQNNYAQPNQQFGQQGQFNQQPMNQMQGQPQYNQQQFPQQNPYQANNQFNNQPYQNQSYQPAPQNDQYGARSNNNQFNRQNNNQFNNQMNGMNQPQNYGQNQMQPQNPMQNQQRQLPSGQFNPRNNMNRPNPNQQQFPQQNQSMNYPAPSNNGQFTGNQFNNNQNNQFGNPMPNNQMNNNQFNNQYPNANNSSNGSYGFPNYDPSQSRSRR
ncbi:hypothetical protein [Companilactobacillus sp. HBUAS59699]|uniref:hypothetical protein n=1 Tax=Companilactobacillus sp. HBUAS59699 TaxID=3109358 RepID=UPI002FF22C5F